MKMQWIIKKKKKKIVYVAFDKGSVHDFTLFKESNLDLDKEINVLGDSSYQDLDKILSKSLTKKRNQSFTHLPTKIRTWIIWFLL